MKAKCLQQPAAKSGGRFFRRARPAATCPALRPGRASAALAVAGIILVTVLSGNVLAAKGGTPGKPVGGETANNLSTPGVQTESVNSIIANWSTPEAPVLGEHYSYGCDVAESDGSFSYPNTSCVNSLSDPTIWYDAAACVLEDRPCEGFLATDLSRIYWQKVDVNEWWADDEGISPDPAHVAYVDWGDALEAVSWNERSVIRVETQPYSSTIDGYLPWESACADATLSPEADCKVGLQMWHVSGQGITEHWGVRADDASVSYNYDSPFQIIKTSNARLNLTKMEANAAVCAQPGEDGEGDQPPELGNWDPLTAKWGAVGEGEEPCKYSDEPYSVETSVGGKYVYGFNWRMKNVDLTLICPGWEKTGFWRLTFYAPADDILFDDANAPNVAPPAIPSEVRALPRTEFNTVMADNPESESDPDAAIIINGYIVVESEEDPAADDRLYRPVIDAANNLTYLDICIVGKAQGGGKGQ